MAAGNGGTPAIRSLCLKYNLSISYVRYSRTDTPSHMHEILTSREIA